MDKIDLTTAGIRAFEAVPPSEAILRFKSSLGEDVAVRIKPAGVRRLHALLTDIVFKFPAPADDN